MVMNGIVKARRQHRRSATEPSVSRRKPLRAITAEPFVRETSLAWALADAAKPHLNVVERSDVYVAIGVGDTFAAIHSLITSPAGRRIAIPAQLVRECHGWLDFYAGHGDEPYLRGLVEQVLTPYAIRSRQG